MKALSALLFALAALLAGCESNPSQPVAATTPPKASIQFADLQGFDRDLTQSLSAPLPVVDVAFYDHVTPSNMPDRLQRWMASIEAGGGTVKVVPPKSTVSAKNPFLLLSVASSIYSASKMAKDASNAAQFAPARNYDAEILLKVDEKGETVVDKVVFAQRKKP